MHFIIHALMNVDNFQRWMFGSMDILDICQRKQYKFGVPAPIFFFFLFLVIWWDHRSRLRHNNDAKDISIYMQTYFSVQMDPLS